MLARATRVVIHSILVLEPSALAKGKITSDNGNSRNFVTLKYLSRDIGNNNLRISVPDYSSRTVETTLLGQFCMCSHFSRKQQHIFYHMLLTLLYSESAYLITLVEP